MRGDVVAVGASLGVVDVEAHALALARHLGELFLLELRERAALGEIPLVQGLVRRGPRLAGHGRAQAAVRARGGVQGIETPRVVVQARHARRGDARGRALDETRAPGAAGLPAVGGGARVSRHADGVTGERRGDP